MHLHKPYHHPTLSLTPFLFSLGHELNHSQYIPQAMPPPRTSTMPPTQPKIASETTATHLHHAPPPLLYNLNCRGPLRIAPRCHSTMVTGAPLHHRNTVSFHLDHRLFCYSHATRQPPPPIK